MSFKGLDEAAKSIQAALKSMKLATSTAADSTIALTALTNPEWEEWEHPRGLDGRFVHKLNGLFIYGFNKKATYTNSTGSKVSVQLQPGDKLYAYSGGAGTKIVQNADGKVGIVDSKTGSIAKWLDASSWIEKNKSKLTLVDQSKGIETKTADAKGLAEATGVADPNKALPKPKLKAKKPHKWMPIATKKALTESKSEKEAFVNVSKVANIAEEIADKADVNALKTLVAAYGTAIPKSPNETGHPVAMGKELANLTQGQLDALGETFESIDDRFDALADLHDLIVKLEDEDPGLTFMPVSEELKMSPAKFLRALVDSYRDEREAQGENLTPNNVLNGVDEVDELVGEGAQSLNNEFPEPVDPMDDAAAAVSKAGAAWKVPDASGKAPQELPDFEPAPQIMDAGTEPPSVTPDDALGAKVVTTKAGPPFGSGVWITPDLTDALGKPYKMSGQGEKSKYWIFPSYAQPYMVTNSKGVEVEGLDPKLAIGGEFENKKAAKAWLAVNAASVVDTEMEPLYADEKPAPAEAVKSLKEALEESMAATKAASLKPPYEPDDAVFKWAGQAAGVFHGAYVVAKPGADHGMLWTKDSTQSVMKPKFDVPLEGVLSNPLWESVQESKPELQTGNIPANVKFSPEDEIWTIKKSNGTSWYIVKHPDGSGTEYMASDHGYFVNSEVVANTLLPHSNPLYSYTKIKDAVLPEKPGEPGIPDVVEYDDSTEVYISAGMANNTASGKPSWMVVYPHDPDKNTVYYATNMDSGIDDSGYEKVTGSFMGYGEGNKPLWNLVKPATETKAPKEFVPATLIHIVDDPNLPGGLIHWQAKKTTDKYGKPYFVTTGDGNYALYDSAYDPVPMDESGTPATFSELADLNAWLKENPAVGPVQSKPAPAAVVNFTKSGKVGSTITWQVLGVNDQHGDGYFVESSLGKYYLFDSKGKSVLGADGMQVVFPKAKEMKAWLAENAASQTLGTEQGVGVPETPEPEVTDEEWVSGLPAVNPADYGMEHEWTIADLPPIPADLKDTFAPQGTFQEFEFMQGGTQEYSITGHTYDGHEMYVLAAVDKKDTAFDVLDASNGSLLAVDLGDFEGVKDWLNNSTAYFASDSPDSPDAENGLLPTPHHLDYLFTPISAATYEPEGATWTQNYDVQEYYSKDYSGYTAYQAYGVNGETTYFNIYDNLDNNLASESGFSSFEEMHQWLENNAYKAWELEILNAMDDGKGVDDSSTTAVPPADDLPEEVEAPTPANPTPGSPASYKAVAVTGYQGVPGTYLTKKHMDETGMPYFITSNGQPNHWEIWHQSDVKSFNTDSSTWNFAEDAKPVGVFKQLKKAKAAIAAQTFESGQMNVDPSTGGFTIVSGNITLNVSKFDTVLHNTDDETYAVFQGSDVAFIKDGYLWAGYGDTVSGLKKQGYAVMHKPTAFDEAAYLPEPEGYDPSMEPTEQGMKSFDWYDSGYDVYNYSTVPGYTLSEAYSMVPGNQTLAEITPALQQLLTEVDSKQAQLKKWLGYAQELYSNTSYGAVKTAITKAKTRIKAVQAAYRISSALVNGQDVDETDIKYLEKIGEGPWNASGNGSWSENNAIKKVVAAGKISVAIQKAKADGFDVKSYAELTNEDLSKKTAGIVFNSPDELQKLQTFAGESGMEYAGFIDNLDLGAKWLATQYISHAGLQVSAAAPFAKKATLQKTSLGLKKYIEEAASGSVSEAKAQALMTYAEYASEWGFGVGSFNFSTAPESLPVSVFVLRPPDPNNPLPVSETVTAAKLALYSYNAYDGHYNLLNDYGTSAPEEFSIAEISAMLAMGTAHPPQGVGDKIKPFGSTSAAFINYNSDAAPALWKVTAADLQSLVGNGMPAYAGYAVTLKKPWMASLVPTPTNPYLALADDPVVWGTLFHKAMENPGVREWVESGGNSEVSGEDLEAAFDVSVEVPDKSYLISFFNDYVLPKMLEQAEKFDFQTDGEKLHSGGGAQSLPSKPAQISEMAWAAALALYHKDDLFPAAGSTYTHSAMQKAKKGLSPIDMAGLDTNLLSNVVAYSVNNQDVDPDLEQIPEAINYLAQKGVWRPSTKKVTLTNGAATVAFHLLPGDKVYNYKGYGAQFMVVHHGGQGGYKVNSNPGGIAYESLNASEVTQWMNPGYGYVDVNNPAHVNPVDMNFEYVQSEIPDITPEAFSMWEANWNNEDYGEVFLPGMDDTYFGDTLLALKQAMSQKPAEYAKISEVGLANIPKGTAKLLHYGVLENNSVFLEMANMYAKYQMLGDTAEESSATGWLSKLDSNTSYYPYLENGTPVDLWPISVADFAGSELIGQDYYNSPDEWTEFAEKLQTYIDSQGTNAGTKAAKAKATGNVPTLYSANFNAHGGSHSLGTWVDEVGNQWISKEFPSDPNAKARVEAEHYAMEIGRLFGFSPPASVLMTLPTGKYAYAQHFAPAKGDLSGYGWNDVPEKVMHDIMQQHVYDWVISNHDSHGGNILLSEDGQDAFPIDRGQAFKFFPTDKLSVGYLPQGNPTPVWYDKVYKAIQSGSMSKEAADRVRDVVLRKAALVTVRNDESYREFVNAALASRDNFPAALPNREAFVEALMKRKASTFDDFSKLWKSIYKSAGYDFDASSDIETWLPKQLGHAHVSVSPDFVENVSAAQASGVPLFFGGTELDNGHMQFYVSKTKDGSDTLRIETRLRSDAAAALNDWLGNQTIEKGSVAPAAYDPYANSNYVDPTDTDEYKMKQLPGLADAHNALVAFVITVGSHLKSKNGEPPDYAFNQGTVTNAENALKNLKDKVAIVEDHIASDEGHITYDGNIYDGKFITMEQQDFWLDAAKTMIENFEIVENAKNTKIPVSQSHPDLVPFEMPEYTPSANLAVSTEAEPIEGYVLGDGTEFTKYSDGSYVKTLPAGGGKQKISKDEFDVLPEDATLVDYSKKADEAGAKKVVEAWTYQDLSNMGYVTFKKWSDGTYSYSAEDGAGDQPATEEDFEYVAKKGQTGATMAGGFEVTSVPVDGGEADIAAGDEEEAVVTSGTKILKITHKKASAFLGSYDPESNVLTETGKEMADSGGPKMLGNEYQIEFEGITIKFQAAKDLPAKASAQHNLMRVSIDKWDGGTQQIDSFIEVLRSMGLQLPEADETEMELMYWRQLTGTLRNRKLNSKQQTLKKRLAAEISHGMTRDQELAKYREIYGSNDGYGDLTKFIGQRAYLPRISKNNKGVRTGRPNWYHPNVDYTALKKASGGQLINHSVGYGGDTSNMANVIKSGFLLSTEERLRLLGKPVSGASSSTDQASHGSSQGVFTRIGDPQDYSIMMEPSVFYRITNYGLDGDQYGEVSHKNTSPFDPVEGAKYYTSNGYHEIMVKDAVSFFDDVAVVVLSNNTQLNAVLKFYKDLGITEIRGIPIEERFVEYTSQAQKTIDKVWKLWEEFQNKGIMWEAMYE